MCFLRNCHNDRHLVFIADASFDNTQTVARLHANPPATLRADIATYSWDAFHLRGQRDAHGTADAACAAADVLIARFGALVRSRARSSCGIQKSRA